jgi:hypothetical protein
MDPNASIPDVKVPDTQEFFENQSQTNALNAKRTYDEFQDLSLASARRSQVNHDTLQSRLTLSLDEALNLQKKVNQDYFDQKARLEVELEHVRSMRQRHADDANYVTRYDLSNPMTTGVADNLRAGAAPSNRITDTVGAVAGGTVDVAAAGVATANLGILQQMIAQLTQATQAIAALVPVLVTAAGGASTPSQTQPKPTA